MGSNVSHFHVSLIVRGKVTRQCPQTTTLLKRKESRNQLNQGPSAYQPNALLLGQTSSCRRKKNKSSLQIRCSLFTGVLTKVALSAGLFVWCTWHLADISRWCWLTEIPFPCTHLLQKAHPAGFVLTDYDSAPPPLTPFPSPPPVSWCFCLGWGEGGDDSAWGGGKGEMTHLPKFDKVLLCV